MLGLRCVCLPTLPEGNPAHGRWAGSEGFTCLHKEQRVPVLHLPRGKHEGTDTRYN